MWPLCLWTDRCLHIAPERRLPDHCSVKKGEVRGQSVSAVGVAAVNVEKPPGLRNRTRFCASVGTAAVPSRALGEPLMH